MAIPIQNNTTALEELKAQAQNLPDKESGTVPSTPTITLPAPSISKSGNKIVAAYTPSKGYNDSTDEKSTTVTAKSLDSNLVASNIKSGVSIFGTTGTYTGSGTSTDTYGNATASDVLDGKTFMSGGTKKTGTMPELSLPNIEITAVGHFITATSKTTASGYLASGLQTTNTYSVPSAEQELFVDNGYIGYRTTSGGYAFSGNSSSMKASDLDTSCVSVNIRKGATIFGVNGSYEGSTQAYTTGTVTVQTNTGTDNNYYALRIYTPNCASLNTLSIMCVENSEFYAGDEIVNSLWYNFGDQKIVICSERLNNNTCVIDTFDTFDMLLFHIDRVVNNIENYIVLYIDNTQYCAYQNYYYTLTYDTN